MRNSNWYHDAFVIFHADHHTKGEWEVGRDADEEQTRKLIDSANPDMIQIHAKGNPGWTTYPSEVGFTPPRLRTDVLRMWQRIAKELDTPFSVYYNLGRDGEIMARRPSANRMDAGGGLRERMLNYSEEIKTTYLWPQITELIDNYEPDGFWFDGSCFTVSTCYQESSLRRWRDESDLPVPRDPSAPGWDQFKEMHREIYRELVGQTARMIHERRPDCLVAVNVAYNILMPEKPDPAIDYLTCDIADHIGTVGPAASMMDGQGLPFDLMVTLWYSDRRFIGEAESSLYPKPLAQLQQEAATIVSRGGRFSAWETPTQESALRASHMEVFADVAAWLRDRQEWCVHSVNVPDVSVLHSPDTHYANTRERELCFPNYAPQLSSACGLLDRSHILYEVLPAWRLEEHNISGKVLVVEDPHVITPAQLAGIRAFAAAGGVVLLTGDAAIAGGPELRDLAGIDMVRTRPAPLEFSLENDRQAPGTARQFYRLKVADGRVALGATLSGNAIPASFGEIPWDDAAPDSYPFLVESASGGVFTCAVPIHSEIATCDSDDELAFLESVWRKVFETVLPPSQRRLSYDGSGTVHLTYRAQDEHSRHVVHLVNRHSGTVTDGSIFPKIESIEPAPPAALTVRLSARPARVYAAPVDQDGSDRPLDFTYKDDELRLVVEGFATHTMVVIDAEG